MSHHSAYHSPHPTPSLPLRAAIEEEYAKRLAKLTKVTLGRDEIGYVLSLIYYLGSSPDVYYLHVKRVSKLARHPPPGDRQAVLLPSTTRPADPQRARKPRCRVRRPSGPTSQRLSSCDRETIQNKTGTGRPRQQGSGEIRAGLPPH